MPVKRPNWPLWPAGRPASAAASIARASPGVGHREDQVLPGGRGEGYSAPVGGPTREPRLERWRRWCARLVTTGCEELRFAQDTTKLGSVAARPASSLTLASAARYLPAASSPIPPAAPVGV